MNINPEMSGALPPPDFAWQIGKNAASIIFVNKAEVFIENGKNPVLAAFVKSIKEGAVTINEFLEPAQFIVE